MNIRQLYIFKTVCEEMNFTRAAKRLFMTQPAVSHVIGDLEEELGGKLFERIARKVHLTEAGQLFLVKVTQLLELYDDLGKDFSGKETKAVLRIGSSITIANYWLPGFLARFKQRFVDTPTEIQVDSAGNIEKRLMDNEVDIAFLEGTVHHRQLVRHPFAGYDMSVLCHPKHPFARAGGQVSPEDFVKEDLLLREKGSAIRDSLDSALLLYHLYAEPVMTSVNSGALVQAVKTGLGISVLPDLLVEQELKSGELIGLNLKGIPLTNRNYLVYHQDKYQSKPLAGLIQIVTE